MWTLDPDIRRRYVRETVKLGVWYVHRLIETGAVASEQAADALTRRVDIYRLTPLWDGTHDTASGYKDPAWNRMARDLAALVTGGGPVAEIEERALAYLAPHLEARVARDVGPPPVRPFGCFTYELGWAGIGDRQGLLGKLTNVVHLGAWLRKKAGMGQGTNRDVALHVMNVKAPRSPFEDMDELAGDLRRLMAEARERHPGVEELWCNTWLNNHGKFLALFPAVWRENAIEQPKGNFRNWWGQFATRTGDFNFELAERFRTSGGEFPFKAYTCHAPMVEIEQHLTANFGEAKFPGANFRG